MRSGGFQLGAITVYMLVKVYEDGKESKKWNVKNGSLANDCSGAEEKSELVDGSRGAYVREAGEYM